MTNFSNGNSSTISGTIVVGGVPEGTFSRLGSSGGGFELGIVAPGLIADVCTPEQFIVVVSGASSDATIVIDGFVQL